MGLACVTCFEQLAAYLLDSVLYILHKPFAVVIIFAIFAFVMT